MIEITEDEMLDLMAQCALLRNPRATETLAEAEKRQSRRWLLNEQYATLYLRGEDHCVAIRDVSLTGMRLANIPETLESGDRAILIVMLEQGPLAVNAEVMHLFVRNDERQAGIRFLLHYSQEINPLIAFLDNASEGVLEQSP